MQLTFGDTQELSKRKHTRREVFIALPRLLHLRSALTATVWCCRRDSNQRCIAARPAAQAQFHVGKMDVGLGKQLRSQLVAFQQLAAIN